MPHPPSRYNPRWEVAEQVAEVVRRRYGSEIRAIGIHGSLAHGEDAAGTDVDLVVITRRPGTGPRPATRRIGGVIVDLVSISGDEYLAHARTLTTSWPLAADQYLTTAAILDPDNWYGLLRDTHLGRLAGADPAEFATLAREAWCRAAAATDKARQLAEWYDTDSAMLVLGEARLGAAMVEGLLSRTYFRNSADAVRRTGLAAEDVLTLGTRLAAQAAELARRGRPVDGEVADLLA
ncbi:hypothetical protein GCM10009682_44230 [Luedemannella flava]|uniref:Polymerase nucleotidyl transferase domain-containing protein n=1 Tax=Luedemannella flava TaxID=349316 RepID=A0ABP4YLN9_9ACTN